MEHLLNTLTSQFDIAVIKSIPITDKFRMVEYVKLMGKMNDYYRDEKNGGLQGLKTSEFYNIDKTLHLFLSWVIDSEVSHELFIRLLKNYIHCFSDSDVYVAYLTTLGFGTLMMESGIDTPSLMSYLTSLLGEEFLKDNYTRIYQTRKEVDLTDEKRISVKYKDFDFTYRKLKYDLLAILKMSKESGGKDLRKLIFKDYENEDLRTMFSVLDVENKAVSDHVFKNLIAGAPKMDRFLLTASKCLLEDRPIKEMHYLLNSEIGKLTNFYKPYEVVMDEIGKSAEAIRAQAKK